MMEHLEQLTSPAAGVELAQRSDGITYGEGSIPLLIKYGADIFKRHWEEVGIWKGVRPLDPDFDLYRALAMKGAMRCFLAIRDEKILGYATYQIHHSLNYKTWLQATNGVFWLDPELRRRNLPGAVFPAFDFFHAAEEWLKGLGVKSIRYATKVGMTKTGVFEVLDYAKVEEVFEKVL